MDRIPADTYNYIYPYLTLRKWMSLSLVSKKVYNKVVASRACTLTNILYNIKEDKIVANDMMNLSNNERKCMIKFIYKMLDNGVKNIKLYASSKDSLAVNIKINNTWYWTVNIVNMVRLYFIFYIDEETNIDILSKIEKNITYLGYLLTEFISSSHRCVIYETVRRIKGRIRCIENKKIKIYMPNIKAFMFQA